MSYNGEIAANIIDTSQWYKQGSVTLDLSDPANIAFTNTNTWGGGALAFGRGGLLPAGTYTLNFGLEYTEVVEQWNGVRIICSETVNGRGISNSTYGNMLGTVDGYYSTIESLPLTFTAESDFAIGFVVESGAGTISELKLEEGDTASAWQPFLDDTSGGGCHYER